MPLLCTLCLARSYILEVCVLNKPEGSSIMGTALGRKWTESTSSGE